MEGCEGVDGLERNEVGGKEATTVSQQLKGNEKGGTPSMARFFGCDEPPPTNHAGPDSSRCMAGAATVEKAGRTGPLTLGIPLNEIALSPTSRRSLPFQGRRCVPKPSADRGSASAYTRPARSAAATVGAREESGLRVQSVLWPCRQSRRRWRSRTGRRTTRAS